MPALPEYKTRVLLKNHGVPLAPGVFLSEIPDVFPEPVVYLKAQIPGATSRAASGLVRRASTQEEVATGLKDLLGRNNCHGVLATEAVDIVKEYYAACLLSFGSEGKLPGGVLLFSPEGGSGIESRSESLVRIPFSLIDPPEEKELVRLLPDMENRSSLAGLLSGMMEAFIEYKLTVLEANPIAVLPDGSLAAIDCRAEYEKHAVPRKHAELFKMPESAEGSSTQLEKTVEAINQADPAGTGFFRSSRIPVPDGAIAVATNLCGGGGKMLWEMATGGRKDVFTLNESDTSGGLSAFKSYRILRVIMSQPEARVLFLTGSGMAFQSQYHLACAVWKALRESSSPLPCLLRFGGTDQEKAFELFQRVGDSLPVKVETFRPEVFPNVMVDRIAELATGKRAAGKPEAEPGTVAFETDTPPARFIYHPDRNPQGLEPACIKSCPTGYLRWEDGAVKTNPEARCIGCLVCETASLLDGNGELTIELDIPGEVL